MNKKAFTIVELIMSFIFVTIVSISMYGLVVNYRSRSSTESIRNELNSFRTKVTIDIEKDIEKYFLYIIDYCKDGSNNILPRCLVLTYKNGDVKTLEIKETVKTETVGEDVFTYNEVYLMYGNVKYTIPDGKFININGDFLLNYTTSDDNLENNMALYRININFTHEELDDDFNIKLTALGNVNPSYSVPVNYTAYSIGERKSVKVGNDTRWFRVIRESSAYNSMVTLLYDDVQMTLTPYNQYTADGNKYEGSLIESTLKYETRSWSNPTTVRLITAEELAYIANICPAYKKTGVSPISFVSTGYTWLYPYSYWTMTPLSKSEKPSDSYAAWYVDGSGIMYGHNVVDSYYLRPVIVISKDYILP